MPNTKLIYMEQMQLLECNTIVEEIKNLGENKLSIILDQTVFYPQGGGQPYDNGIIKNENIIFNVNEVRFIDGQVHHIGTCEKSIFKVGDMADCVVERDRRQLNTRLHSAGHLLDMALKELGKLWKPGKGYHFPNGPYVEYFAEHNTLNENLKIELQNKCNEIISRNIETTIKFMDKSEMKKCCHFVPDFLPEGKPGRVVFYGNFGIPCGGTHCKNLNEIQKMSIRKIKKEKDMIKVSYEL